MQPSIVTALAHIFCSLKFLQNRISALCMFCPRERICITSMYRSIIWDHWWTGKFSQAVHKGHRIVAKIHRSTPCRKTAIDPQANALVPESGACAPLTRVRCVRMPRAAFMHALRKLSCIIHMRTHSMGMLLQRAMIFEAHVHIHSRRCARMHIHTCAWMQVGQPECCCVEWWQDTRT